MPKSTHTRHKKTNKIKYLLISLKQVRNQPPNTNMTTIMAIHNLAKFYFMVPALMYPLLMALMPSLGGIDALLNNKYHKERTGHSNLMFLLFSQEGKIALSTFIIMIKRGH